MSPLKVEVFNPNNDTWMHVGEVKWGDIDATISANNPDGSRDIYLFGVDMINRQGYVKKSMGGYDIADTKNRVVNSLGFLTVATLNNAESYEIQTITDHTQVERKIKLTYIDED